jgi:hypothetical protein
MSKKDDMEVDTDRSHGLRGTTDNIVGQESRRHKGGSRGADENERESSYNESKQEKSFTTVNSQGTAITPKRGLGTCSKKEQSQQAQG